MALKLAQDYMGGSYEYWVAEPHNDKLTNKTFILMLLFKDKVYRDGGGKYVAREKFEWDMGGCYPSGVDVYAHVKVSHLDTQGNELNKFVNAEDC